MMYRFKASHISKAQLWFIFLFPTLFVADIMYGILDYYGLHLPASPGVILRGFAFFLSFVMFLRYYRIVSLKVRLWVLAIVISALPSIIGGIVVGGDIARDLYYLSRVFYGPFLLLLVIILIRRYLVDKDVVLRFIECSAYFLGVSLFVSQLFGIQRETYGYYAHGNIGVFHAQNDLTLAMGLALIAASYRLLESFSFKRLSLIALSTFACLQIGTRSSLAVALVCALVTVLQLVWGRQSKEKGSHIFRLVGQWLVGVVLVVGMMGFFSYGLNLQNQTSFQKEKIERLTKGELPRLRLLAAAQNHLDERPGWLDITGEGMTSFMWGVARYFPTATGEKMVEVDWIDFYGAYGLLFTSVLYSFFFVILLGAAKRFLFGAKDKFFGLVAAVLLMYLAHSALAGHALGSPISTTLVAGYIGTYLTSITPLKGNSYGGG